MGFTSPPNPAQYYQQVWALVRQIPAGKVASYGMIAALIPLPPNISPEDYRAWGARWVGGAMARGEQPGQNQPAARRTLRASAGLAAGRRGSFRPRREDRLEALRLGRTRRT